MSAETVRIDDEHAGFQWFVGIDWGTAQHVVHVSNTAGTPVATRTIDHTRAGLTQLTEWLTTLTGGQLGRVAVAIEIPRGAVVETLLESGVVVFAVNPKQLDRFRDRFSVAGAKDDRLDARVLSSALRTDRERFRRLALEEPLVIRIRELTRAEAVLQEEFLGLTNRVRELVHRVVPEWLTLSPSADEPWFWMVLERMLGRASATKRHRHGLEQLLKTYRIRRWTADDVLRVLAAPPLVVAPGTTEAVTTHLQLLLPRVRLVHEQRQTCERALTAALAELATVDAEAARNAPRPPDDPPRAGSAAAPAPEPPAPDPGDVTILRSAPGIGVGVAAAFIAEARRLLTLRDYGALRTLTGVAPVRRQTGKNARGLVGMRSACNHRLRNACYHWARVSTQVDTAARQYYATLRARGHSHGRALRSVADRWLRILVAMLTHRTVYDPARFTPA